jgi:hypothetical protein
MKTLFTDILMNEYLIITVTDNLFLFLTKCWPPPLHQVMAKAHIAFGKVSKNGKYIVNISEIRWKLWMLMCSIVISWIVIVFLNGSKCEVEIGLLSQ